MIYYLNCEEDENLWHSDVDVNGVYTCEVEKDIKLWIIKNKKILLTKVNGILFDQKTFKKDHPKVVENGIIPVSSIIKHFPDYHPIMLISFFENMGLCHLISPLFLLHTNLVTKEDFTIEDIYGDYYDKTIYHFNKCGEVLNKIHMDVSSIEGITIDPNDDRYIYVTER